MDRAGHEKNPGQGYLVIGDFLVTFPCVGHGIREHFLSFHDFSDLHLWSVAGETEWQDKVPWFGSCSQAANILSVLVFPSLGCKIIGSNLNLLEWRQKRGRRLFLLIAKCQWETGDTRAMGDRCDHASVATQRNSQGTGMERVPPKMCGVYRRMEQLSGFSPQFTGNDCKENYGFFEKTWEFLLIFVVCFFVLGFASERLTFRSIPRGAHGIAQPPLPVWKLSDSDQDLLKTGGRRTGVHSSLWNYVLCKYIHFWFE